MHSRDRHALLVALALVMVSVAMSGQPQHSAEEAGITGLVLAPDKTPVSAGTVTIQSLGGRTTIAIDRRGRFQFVPTVAGLHQLLVNVSGLTPYRVHVVVPPSRTVRLPAIQMLAGSYFRARFVSAQGEPVTTPRLRRESFDVYGTRLWDPPFDDRPSEEIDGEGTITIGPLPRGVTTLTLDAPPLPQTRLPDLFVTGAEGLRDMGTVIVQPGAALHVDVVDAAGAPVPRHEVLLEDALPLSPRGYQTVRSDRSGRATFERLGTGRYRVRTRVLGLCENGVLWTARAVTVSGSETLRMRLVIAGNATFRVTSPLGALRGVLLSAAPDVSPTPPPSWLRARGDSPPSLGTAVAWFPRETLCAGRTDDDGRVTLNNFPPGPTRVHVYLLNSTYVRRLSVPENSRELPIVIPEGYLPLRVTNATTNAPVAAADITWTGAGGRVQATASGNGEALLEGVGTTAGTLAITAPRLQHAEIKLLEPPATLHEIALVPAPISSMQVHVVSTSGQSLPNAVVELFPEDSLEIPQIAVTDGKGLVSFPDAPLGTLRLTAILDAFAPAVVHVTEDQRTGVVLTLSPTPPVVARASAFAPFRHRDAPRRREQVVQGATIDSR